MIGTVLKSSGVRTRPASETLLVGFVLTLPFGLVGLGPLDLVQVTALLLVLGVGVLHQVDGPSRTAVGRVALLGITMLVVAALATPFSEAPNATFRADTQLVIGVALAMAVAAVCSGGQALTRVLGALAVVGTAVAVHAILTVGQQRALDGGGVVDGRATGVFDQPNELGAFLAALLVLTLGGLAWAPSRRGRVLALLGTAVMTVGLALSLSRGAWIGALLGVIVLLVLVPTLRMRVGGVFSGVAFLVVAAATVLNLPELAVIRDRLGSFTNPSDNPYDNRALIYSDAIRMIDFHPVLGHGPGAFPEVAGQTTSGKQGLSAEHGHNLLLTVATEYGLVGVAALLFVAACLGYWAWEAVRVLRRTRRLGEAAACAALVGALVTVAGHGIVDYPLRNSLMYFMCWVLLGALVGATSGARHERVS